MRSISRSLGAAAVLSACVTVPLSVHLTAQGPLRAVAWPAPPEISLGASFSPDSQYLAIARPGERKPDGSVGRILEILSLRDRRQINRSEIPVFGFPHASNYLLYSHDGRCLLSAPENTSVVAIRDANTLNLVREVDLYGGTHQKTPGSIEGVLAVAASDGDLFAVLTSDRIVGAEVFVVSFSDGRILAHWVLERGRTGDALGRISLAFDPSANRVVVSRLPRGFDLPKNFATLQVFEANSGRLLKSVHTDMAVGPIAFISAERLIAARIDRPRSFGNTCLVDWNLETNKVVQSFCDRGRDVISEVTVTRESHRVASFAAQLHRDLEGHVSGGGRVDVWDSDSIQLLASSPELSGGNGPTVISPDGRWLLAGTELFAVSGP